jgi:hypothetical protein
MISRVVGDKPLPANVRQDIIERTDGIPLFVDLLMARLDWLGPAKQLAQIGAGQQETPSPNGRRVGIRIVTFEACSGFTHVTARRIAQPPTGDLCHEAPTHAVTRTSRSSATGSSDNSPGGFLLH